MTALQLPRHVVGFIGVRVRHFIGKDVGLRFFDGRFWQVRAGLGKGILRGRVNWCNSHDGLLSKERLTDGRLFRRTQRGRGCSLPIVIGASCGNSPTAGARFDHPRLHPGRFHEDTLFVAKGADGITSDFYGFEAIESHVARLEGGVVHDVTIIPRPPLEKFNGVFQARYLFDQISAFLEIYGPIENFRVHSYLTENVGDQQGWRLVIAPIQNLFSAIFDFKTRGSSIGKILHWRADRAWRDRKGDLSASLLREARA